MLSLAVYLWLPSAALGIVCTVGYWRLRINIWKFLDVHTVFSCDWGEVGILRAVQDEALGCVSGVDPFEIWVLMFPSQSCKNTGPAGRGRKQQIIFN